MDLAVIEQHKAAEDERVERSERKVAGHPKAAVAGDRTTRSSGR